MTPDEAFKKFLTAHEHNDLPWEIQEEEMRPTFMAGWHAHAESLNQSTLVLESDEPQRVDKHIGVPVTTGHYGLFERKPEEAAPVAITDAGGVLELCAATIYAAYPRKIGKQAALKAITKASRTVGYHTLYERTKAYATATASWPAHEKKYIPHPATWFNRGSYEDDPKEWQRGAGAFVSQFNRVRT